MTRHGRIIPTLVGGAAAVALSLTGATIAQADTASDDAAAKTVVYVEVNDNDFANVADYTLEGTQEGAFDIAAIFAANINYDGTAAQLHFNERVTWTLDNAETQIRPVQERGTKVLLSVLGNHQGAGFANFTTPAAADAFAAQLEAAVDTYGLDGIDFDDEWTKYGTNNTPQPNDESFGWLLESLRERLGSEKLITLYAIGPTYDTTDFTKVNTASLLDYSWNPYYGGYTEFPVAGLTRDRLGAAAVDFTQQSAATAADLANRTKVDGYGIYVTYNLGATDVSDYMSGITQVLDGKKTIYKQVLTPSDTTAPTAIVITSGQYTAAHGGGPSYNKVGFSLADEGGITSATLNGKPLTITAGATQVTVGSFKPNRGGAVSGANTLVVTDAAGNSSTTTFTLR